MSITLETQVETPAQATDSCCGSTVVEEPAASGCCGPEPVEEREPSCCGTAPEPVEEEASSCCGSADAPVIAIPVIEAADGGCCGTQRTFADAKVGVSLQAAVSMAGAGLRESDAWPYVLPAWLTATEASLDGAKPWHSVARSGDNAVFLPGFVFESPSLVDADPRTYLGWEAPSGEAACCGVKACCGTQDQVDALGTDLLFPALVLGSPLGYRSDAVAVGDQDPQLTVDLIDQLIPAAQAAGVRSIVAPWVSDRPVNGPLLAALHAQGANISFWGEENHLELEHPSYAAHLAALPARKRRRIKEDNDKAAASGARLVRVDGEQLRPLVARIAELTILNRQKYDGCEGADHITALLTALIDDGADVRAHLAYKDDLVVGSALTIRQGRRLIVKWAGFDYEALGERSGLYFSLVLDRPLQDAFAEGLDSVEIGPGADQAKRLRGCQPRPIYTALWVSDASARDTVAALQGTYGGARRQALGAETAEEPELSTTARLFGRLRPKKAEAAEGCCG